MTNVRLVYRGGGTADDARREPPENETAYPEPSMFGTLPAYGFFVRHARNVVLRDVELGFDAEDLRSALVLHDVSGVHMDHVTARVAKGIPVARLRDVRNASAAHSPGVLEGNRR